MPIQWKRKTWVTRSADPTQVVSWSYRLNGLHISITEFQGVTQAMINGNHAADRMQEYWKQRFDKLESDWQELEDQKSEAVWELQHGG